MHTQPGIVDLRKILQLREDLVRGQASSHQQLAEEMEEEGEEEEQVRLRAFVFYPQFQAILMQNYTCLRQGPGTIRLYISHLLYFMHTPEWTLTVIICPLKATREIMAHNSLSMYF